MAIPSTGVVLVDILIAFVAIFITAGGFLELYRGIVNSISNRSKKKAEDTKNSLVAQELNRRAALHYELLYHEAVRIGVKHGIPLEEFPDSNPPTGSNPVIRKVE